MIEKWLNNGTCVYFGEGGIDLSNAPDPERRARLIAAAPELLDALEYALPYLRACVPFPRNGHNPDGSVDVNCVDRAIAAIAKARGGA